MANNSIFRPMLADAAPLCRPGEPLPVAEALAPADPLGVGPAVLGALTIVMPVMVLCWPLGSVVVLRTVELTLSNVDSPEDSIETPPETVLATEEPSELVVVRTAPDNEVSAEVLSAADEEAAADSDEVAVVALLLVLLLVLWDVVMVEFEARFARYTSFVASLGFSLCTASMAVLSFEKMPSRNLLDQRWRAEWIEFSSTSARSCWKAA